MTNETDAQERRSKAPDITSVVSLEPMDVGFDPVVIEDLRERLRRTRRPAALDDDWARGVPASWLSDVLAYWQAFDVAAFQQQLAGLTHVRAGVDDQMVHALVAAGRGPDPLPLLLANGWPSSFCEYLHMLPLLTDPGGHGGDPADAFTVVAPALPGFGFSAPPPPAGVSPVRVADMWYQLMTHGFGHPRYVAHGSDLGAGVVAHLARAHPASVAGIHLATPGLPLSPQPWTPAERGLRRRRRGLVRRGGQLRPPARHEARHGRCRPARLACRAGRVDRREDRGLEQCGRRRAAGVPPRPAARHPDPLLGHRDDHLGDAPVLELSPHRGSRSAARRSVPGAHRGEHLRRRAGPVSAAAP
jgi:pimeloyl-ACP methyl ester carboxylesterase